MVIKINIVLILEWSFDKINKGNSFGTCRLFKFTNKESYGNRVFRKFTLWWPFWSAYAVAVVGMVLVKFIGNAQYSVLSNSHLMSLRRQKSLLCLTVQQIQ